MTNVTRKQSATQVFKQAIEEQEFLVNVVELQQGRVREGAAEAGGGGLTARPAWRPLPARLPSGVINASLGAVLCCCAALSSLTAFAQGVLTVTPGSTIGTAAGSAQVGYSGDGGPASSATFARPSAVARDSAGDLFIADANNNAVREITPAGTISTVAGTGIAGFGGDGGAATAALLDTPTGVAVDALGNIYIADSHNHRIRVVKNGVITTVAGTGVAGFSGDGGAATGAQLDRPGAVALDANQNLFIADTNNQRVRRVVAGIITTVAGNGEELFAGDGGQATAASLDQPTGVAVDAAGNLYIADKSNQRIRVVNAAGVISTFAGNGAGPVSGAFGGDGAAATAAALAKPVGVAVSPSGDVYIADTNNQRIRQISPNGIIVTVAGTGDQGYAGDGGPAVSAILNSPRALLTDAAGSLSIVDTANQRLRSTSSGMLSFAAQSVGNPSAPQSITLSNSGTAPLTVASVTFTGPFLAAAGGSCSSTPIHLSPGAGCTLNIAFQPSGPGQVSGAVSIGGQGVNTQTVQLNGSGTSATTRLLVAANKNASLSGEQVTLTANLVNGNNSATAATGTVNFYAGTTPLGSANLVQGAASITTTQLASGLQTITAVFAGGAGYDASTSNAFTEYVADLDLTLAGQQALTVVPGQSINVPLSLAVTGDNGLSGKITLATSALPAGLSVVFNPSSTPLASGQLPVTMTVTANTANTTVAALVPFSGIAGTLVLFPAFRRRRRLPGLRVLGVLCLSLGGLVALGALAGCGGNTGFFGQKQQTYNIGVAATANDGTGGTLTRNLVVTVVVQ